jgi:peptidoglycan/LPS O-acetylase OafA/YrhL
VDPVSPLPAIAALGAAIVTTHLIAVRFGAPPDQGRFAAIDGLRGYLAFFVFLHHSSVWYFYLRTGQWRVPPSNLYAHFGQSSVTLFFMITGFLFFSKLIDGRTRGVDWGRLFVSRFLRLVPLYLFAMLLLFSVVALLSNGVLNVPLPKLIRGVIRWLGFTILGSPSLNGIDQTSIIVAQVTWSLPYEWFFYFSLPLLALTVRVIPSLPYVILGIASIVGLSIWHPQTYPLLSFLGGIAASFLVRWNPFRQFAVGRISSLLAIGCIVMAVSAFPSPYGIVPLLLLSLAFSLIAGGCSMFRVLVSPVSRTLGEMTYSIYLLHGIALFIAFTFLVGINEAKNLSPVTHWMLIVGISPILILASFCTFRFIERPAMQSTPAVTAWLRSHLTHGLGGAVPLRRIDNKAKDS